MHEASVVANIVDAVLEELDTHNITKVNSVTLVIGELTMLGTEQMEFAFEILTENNILKGSKLIIEPEAVLLSCGSCGYEGPADRLKDGEFAEQEIPVLCCPRCGGTVKILEGESCRVKCMDVETGDE